MSRRPGAGSYGCAREDQFCWNSGCHGARPYENGFTLPRQVPAIIGGSSLNQFATAADLYAYIRAAMPLQAPTTLADEEYLAIVAFLARAHDVWGGKPVTAVSAPSLIFNTPEPISAEPAPTAVPSAAAPAAPGKTFWLMAGILLLFLLTAGGVLWLKRTQ